MVAICEIVVPWSIIFEIFPTTDRAWVGVEVPIPSLVFIVVVFKVVRPVTAKLVEVRFVIVVFPKLVIPVTDKLVEVIEVPEAVIKFKLVNLALVEVILVPVALMKLKLLKKALVEVIEVPEAVTKVRPPVKLANPEI